MMNDFIFQRCYNEIHFFPHLIITRNIRNHSENRGLFNFIQVVKIFLLFMYWLHQLSTFLDPPCKKSTVRRQKVLIGMFVPLFRVRHFYTLMGVINFPLAEGRLWHRHSTETLLEQQLQHRNCPD